MRELLDGNDLASYLRMLRSADARVFLVLEGDSDVRGIRRTIDEKDCELIPGYGKSAVIEAIDILAVTDPDGVVALVDRDFGHWSSEHLPRNVMTTGLYDREADLLLLGGLLADYLNACQDHDRAKALVEAAGEEDLIGVIVGIAATVGRLRWASIRDQIDLSLSRFPFGSAGILAWPGQVDVDAVIRLAMYRTENGSSSPENIRASHDIDPPTEDLRELCNGHDLVAAVAVSSHWWGPKSVGAREVTTFITAALRCDVLQRLRWYRELDDWASSRGRRIWDCAA